MKNGNGTTKYMVKAIIDAEGVVERPDIIGAVFGQTEGLMGNSLDLRELQKTGRIGRIKVNVKSEQGKSTGVVTIPSSLDKAHTAIIAAALETIDRVGPCEAKISIEGIQDVRDTKRKFIVDRASQILEKFDGAAPDKEKLSKMMEGFEHPTDDPADIQAVSFLPGASGVGGPASRRLIRRFRLAGPLPPPTPRPLRMGLFLSGRPLARLHDLLDDQVERPPARRAVQRRTRRGAAIAVVRVPNR